MKSLKKKGPHSTLMCGEKKIFFYKEVIHHKKQISVILVHFLLYFFHFFFIFQCFKQTGDMTCSIREEEEEDAYIKLTKI